MFFKGKNVGGSFFVLKIQKKNKKEKGQKMKKKKTLWSVVSVLIIVQLVLTVLTGGYVLLGLSILSLIAWSIWASKVYFIPRIKEWINKKEAHKLRIYYEDEERKLKKTTMNDCNSHSLLLHVNHRITSYLQSAYPGSSWEWRVEDPEALVSNGGTGRIQVFGVTDFSHADVTINKKAEITYEMLKVVPIGEDPAGSSEKDEATPASPKNPINPQVWYEQKGRIVLENIITDLNSRGHNSLSITESGDVIITQDERAIKKATLEAMPDKIYWHGLAKVFQSEGLAASVTDDAVVVSW